MSQKPLWYRWARVYFTGFSIIGFGVLCFKYTVPTDEQLIARFSPEVRAEYEKGRELRRQEQQELMKIAQKTAASSDPIWKTDKIKSPFEKDGRGVDPKLVDRENFFKKSADEVKRSQVQAAALELEEAEKLAKKSWWRH